MPPTPGKVGDVDGEIAKLDDESDRFKYWRFSRSGVKEGQPNPEHGAKAVEDEAVALALKKSPVCGNKSNENKNRHQCIR